MSGVAGVVEKSPRLGQLAERAVDVIEQGLAETPCQAITGKRQNIGQRGGSNAPRVRIVVAPI